MLPVLLVSSSTSRWWYFISLYPWFQLDLSQCSTQRVVFFIHCSDSPIYIKLSKIQLSGKKWNPRRLQFCKQKLQIERLIQIFLYQPEFLKQVITKSVYRCSVSERVFWQYTKQCDFTPTITRKPDLSSGAVLSCNASPDDVRIKTNFLETHGLPYKIYLATRWHNFITSEINPRHFFNWPFVIGQLVIFAQWLPAGQVMGRSSELARITVLCTRYAKLELVGNESKLVTILVLFDEVWDMGDLAQSLPRIWCHSKAFSFCKDP